jgi:lipoate-protein ligase A
MGEGFRAKPQATGSLSESCQLPRTECQLQVDVAAPGPWNMAVDEALLEWSAASGRACWRFYRWAEPTLSLGYFQRYEDRLEHSASRDCEVVRRPSGGGAIVHDRELTYCVVLPAGHPLATERLVLYDAVHRGLAAALARWGIAATLCPGPTRSSARQPFLCFQRRTQGDVLLGETKIAGSAQRRAAGAVLQHGSVLLERSEFAPELPGLSETTPASIGGQPLLDAWIEELAARLSIAWERAPLDPQISRRAEALIASKYASNAWTIRRKWRPATRQF